MKYCKDCISNVACWVADKCLFPDKAVPAAGSVTHCAAVVMMSPDDPTTIMLRQELVCADDIESAVDAAKTSAIADNPGWVVQSASALYLSPNSGLNER
jgi:hypothetical protein